MAKYAVIVSTEKTILVNAVDQESAMELAEIKCNKNNNKWSSVIAYEISNEVSA